MFKFISFLGLVATIVWFASEPGYGPFIAFLGATATFFRDEIYGVIGLNIVALTPKSTLIRDLTNLKYSFFESEYIHPKIIEDLCGFLSDVGDQVVSINVSSSNKSNKYHGEISVTATDDYPIIKCTEDRTYFEYQYIGRSFCGIHILQTAECGGGTGVFGSLILVTLSSDHAISYGKGSETIKIDRFVIKKVGHLLLGDRYGGKITYRFGLLTIPVGPVKEELRKRPQRLLIL